MRAIAAVSMIVFGLVSPVFADERNIAADDYYACLVGRGAVELHYGATLDAAVEVIRDACDPGRIDADQDKVEGDLGDIVDAAFVAAREALQAIADARN